MNYKLIDLINLLGCEVEGDYSTESISGLTPFFHSLEDSVTFAAEEKFLNKISETRAKYVIVPAGIQLPEIGKVYLRVKDNPRVLMPKLLNFFKKPVKPMTKMIEDSARLGKNCQIAPNVYLGHDVVIGDNVVIMTNSVICEGVVIGDNSIIYPNVTVREFCKLGQGVILQPGAVVGSDGFGYVKVGGNNTKIDQIGTVILEDFVEVGANTTIDRGAIGDTIVKKYTKIDNLVQIAHNVILGENNIIIAQVGIAGSSETAENVTLAGKAGVSGHIKIGPNTVVGAGSMVISDTKGGEMLSGFPVIPHKDEMRQKAAIRKLPDVIKKIKEIEKLVENMLK